MVRHNAVRPAGVLHSLPSLLWPSRTSSATSNLTRASLMRRGAFISKNDWAHDSTSHRMQLSKAKGGCTYGLTVKPCALQATVGAGLPVIATLQHLIHTGDKITRIEGIFSGTLSYIFNSFTPSTRFSEVVATAKELGYTEPDPRDDLAGMDVARKVTILAR